MMVVVRDVRVMLVRELRALIREVEAYPSDASVWTAAPGVANAGGTLVLHLAGNLQHFVGTILGGSEYVRNRDAEFSRRGVSRAELVAEVEATIRAVEVGMGKVSVSQFEAPYPIALAGRTIPTREFLIHLVSHLGYHLGQVDYHRRLVGGAPGAVGTLPLDVLGVAV